MAEAPPADGTGRRSLRSVAADYRVRILLAIVLAVAVALVLVLLALPRLLDGYFATQEQRSLQSRADAMAALLGTQLAQYATLDADTPRPILLGLPGERSIASDLVYRAFGSPGDGFVASLTPRVALADVHVSLAPAPGSPEVAFEMDWPLDDSAAQPGQQRERIAASTRVTVPDTWWTEDPQAAPRRELTVTLSDPFTFRAQTTQTIAEVLLTAALLALIVAIVTAIVLAQWLTRPLRRMTQASRLLAEGQLDARVDVGPNASPEVVELARAFNDMAERLQESIGIISQDRDRSRDFLADVSHELRTPIAAMRTFNELLRDGAANDAATRDEFLEQSARQIERLDWLAQNLLELSKLDSGLVSLDLRPDDLRVAAESAIAQAEPIARRKGVALELRLPDRPLRQPHDPPRIGQVLVNLVNNAVKFTPAGGTVELIVRAVPEGAELVVRDTGVGIDASELPHVFDRFYRGSRTPAERASGSGLGLSIVKSIVDMHGGRVSITSTAGHGTEVLVSLPREVSQSSPSGARQ
jgi:signal transduction histidine kinase